MALTRWLVVAEPSIADRLARALSAAGARVVPPEAAEEAAWEPDVGVLVCTGGGDEVRARLAHPALRAALEQGRVRLLAGEERPPPAPFTSLRARRVLLHEGLEAAVAESLSAPPRPRDVRPLADDPALDRPTWARALARVHDEWRRSAYRTEGSFWRSALHVVGTSGALLAVTDGFGGSLELAVGFLTCAVGSAVCVPRYGLREWCVEATRGWIVVLVGYPVVVMLLFLAAKTAALFWEAVPRGLTSP